MTCRRWRARPLDQRADIRGNVTVTGRPVLTPAWRLEPNLTAQVSVADVALSLAGQRLSLANEVRPMLERSVDEEVRALQARLRSDPFLEQAARKQWAKLCHSFPLGAAAPGLPNLWLELRPTRAFAAQPRFDAAALTLTLGMEAQTRIVPSETKPDCPFPATLEIVPPLERGRVNIAVPIDVPFTEVNRLIAAQLTGKTFPQDQSSGVSVLVRSANVAPSGDRLLISLRVKANETTSWFGLGTEATVHIWGKPALDREQQVMRLTDVALDVEFGRVSGRSGAGGSALPEGRAGGERGHRPQAVHRQCPQEHRHGDCRFPRWRGGRAHRCRRQRSAARRDRLRRPDLAPDRGGQWHGAGRGQRAAGTLTPTTRPTNVGRGPASRLYMCTMNATPNSGVARLRIGTDTKAAMNMPATKIVP